MSCPGPATGKHPNLQMVKSTNNNPPHRLRNISPVLHISAIPIRRTCNNSTSFITDSHTVFMLFFWFCSLFGMVCVDVFSASVFSGCAWIRCNSFWNTDVAYSDNCWSWNYCMGSNSEFYWILHTFPHRRIHIVHSWSGSNINCFR